MEKLYNLARNGNKKALDELFKINYYYVEDVAYDVYDSITNNVKLYCNCDNIPNGLIDFEDILQDLSIKTYQIIIKYFSFNSVLSFNSYLSAFFKRYKERIIKSKMKEIINRLNNFTDEQINFQFRDYNEDYNTIFELIDLINNDPKFNNYYDLVCDIFKGYNYSDLAQRHNLISREINVKMKLISKLHKDTVANENILYDYIKNKMVDELKNGDLYHLSYFRAMIIFNIHDIYVYLKDKYYLEYSIVKNEYLKILCSHINRSKDSINNSIDFANYISNVLFTSKDIYLKHKIKELEYIKSGKYNKFFIKDTEISRYQILDLISNGKIYQIYPYCNYIDMIIEEIYIKTSGEKRRIKSAIKSTVDTLVNNFFKKYRISIDEFNLIFKEKLSSKLYIDCKKNKIIKK